MAQKVKNHLLCRRPGSAPGLGRAPREGNSNPLPYSCMENYLDRGAWQATVHGAAESQTRLRARIYYVLFQTLLVVDFKNPNLHIFYNYYQLSLHLTCQEGLQSYVITLNGHHHVFWWLACWHLFWVPIEEQKWLMSVWAEQRKPDAVNSKLLLRTLRGSVEIPDTIQGGMWSEEPFWIQKRWHYIVFD